MTLVCEGVPIALGELLKINGQTGTRLTSMAADEGLPEILNRQVISQRRALLPPESFRTAQVSCGNGVQSP